MTRVLNGVLVSLLCALLAVACGKDDKKKEGADKDKKPATTDSGPPAGSPAALGIAAKKKVNAALDKRDALRDAWLKEVTSEEDKKAGLAKGKAFIEKNKDALTKLGAELAPLAKGHAAEQSALKGAFGKRARDAEWNKKLNGLVDKYGRMETGGQDRELRKLVKTAAGL